MIAPAALSMISASERKGLRRWRYKAFSALRRRGARVEATGNSILPMTTNKSTVDQQLIGDLAASSTRRPDRDRGRAETQFAFGSRGSHPSKLERRYIRRDQSTQLRPPSLCRPPPRPRQRQRPRRGRATPFPSPMSWAPPILPTSTSAPKTLHRGRPQTVKVGQTLAGSSEAMKDHEPDPYHRAAAPVTAILLRGRPARRVRATAGGHRISDRGD